ncbi:MAG: hypothetical protein HQM11_03830 [SAR324 cluster bacterium]|nr:hypothetical protein [SAR324 cluster bacterium]
MLHIGIIGGSQKQIDTLLAIHNTNKVPFFSRSNAVISVIEAEESAEELLIDALFYVSPVSHLEHDSKQARASMKWIRGLRNYSSYGVRKTIRGCHHLLIGDIPQYLNQIKKMDIDLFVHFQENPEWQIVDSIELLFHKRDLIEMPEIHSVTDSSKNTRQASTNVRIPVSEIDTVRFQENGDNEKASLNESSPRFHSVRLKDQEGAQTIAELKGVDIPFQNITSLTFKQKGQGRMSLPVDSIQALKSGKHNVWALELFELWKIREKVCASGTFQLRLDATAFKDLVIDEASYLPIRLNHALSRVNRRCEAQQWDKYMEFRTFSLQERPVLIALDADLAAILVKQIGNIGFKDVRIITNDDELGQTLNECHLFNENQEFSTTVKFPTLITTQARQAQIKQQYPAIQCYGIPGFDLIDPKNIGQNAERELLKNEVENKIQSLLQEAENNPLQTFYLKIVHLFMMYQLEENTTDIIAKLQKQTEHFIGNLSRLFQAEARKIQEQKNLKLKIEAKIKELNAEITKLNLAITEAEQKIKKLDGALQQKKALTDQMAEQEHTVNDLKDQISATILEQEKLKLEVEADRADREQTTLQLEELKKKYDDLLFQHEKNKVIFGTPEQVARIKKQIQKFPARKQSLEDQIAATQNMLDTLSVAVKQLNGTQNKCAQLETRLKNEKHTLEQLSEKVEVTMGKHERALKAFLLHHEKVTSRLNLVQEALNKLNLRYQKLSTDLMGRESAYQQEKSHAESFGQKILNWIRNIGDISELGEGLSTLGNEADVGLREIKELIEMINKLMTLRKIQDADQSLVTDVMATLEKNFTFYHLPQLEQLEAPLVFIGDKMNYPVFTNKLLSMVQANEQKGVTLNWDRFEHTNVSFSKQIILLDLSDRADDEELHAKVGEFCMQLALQNFMIILLPDEVLFDPKWQVFRSMSLCLPAKHLDTFLAPPLFQWMQNIQKWNAL